MLVGLTGKREFDAVIALILSGFLIFSATRIGIGAMRQIMDVRLPVGGRRHILKTIQRSSGDVRGFHKLRTRRSGRQRYVELHLIVDEGKSVREMHAICDAIEKEIIAALPGAEVTIHVEPDDGRFRHRAPSPVSVLAPALLQLRCAVLYLRPGTEPAESRRVDEVRRVVHDVGVRVLALRRACAVANNVPNHFPLPRLAFPIRARHQK